MARVAQGPLTEADYQVINTKLSEMERLRVELEKALAAGFPCAEQDEACRAVRDQLVKIKKVYFPDRP